MEWNHTFPSTPHAKILKIIEVNYIILFIYAIETCGTPFSLQIEISQLMAHLQVISVLNYVTPL
jgi:hypothetical protein